MPLPDHSIFISYRQSETAFAVDQLDKALRTAFGTRSVFRDVQSIRKGQDFPGEDQIFSMSSEGSPSLLG